MDLELGLKITKTRDDVASISEYRFAKAEPIFQSRETNTAFILTAHLKGQSCNIFYNCFFFCRDHNYSS